MNTDKNYTDEQNEAARANGFKTTEEYLAFMAWIDAGQPDHKDTGSKAEWEAADAEYEATSENSAWVERWRKLREGRKQ